MYLHWFDVLFHRTAGPAVRYGAKLVRYADDFVVLAKRAEPGIDAFLESTLIEWPEPGDQPGENAYHQSEGQESELGLFGFHIPLGSRQVL